MNYCFLSVFQLCFIKLFQYGIVKLKWSAVSPTLYTIGLDGCVRQYDGRNGELMKCWQGHQANILDFDIAR